MTTSLTIVDTEATVRDWARTEAHITAQVSTRVFFSTPVSYEKVIKNGAAPSNSYIVCTLVAESHEPGDLGLQQALIQFDCYGIDKLTAANVALAVQTAARQLSFGHPVTVGSAVITWADVQQRRWHPDPTVNLPRYVVDILFAIHGAEA